MVLSFINVFPQQGNGYPGTTFGNQCSGATFRGPGPAPTLDALQSSCPAIATAIPACQGKYGKTVLLSLGDGHADRTYQLTGAAAGVAFADMVWQMFGPRVEANVARGVPRPFDLPGKNGAVELDRFDFDIETAPTDNSDGYVAMIKRLRALFATTKSPRKYLITGSPQCVVPDANMGAIIARARFDALFVQY